MTIEFNMLENRMPPFTQISNYLIEDNRLSLPARMVMIYLLSKPKNWMINNFDVMKKLGIKRRETIAGYWKELIDKGWIFRQACNSEGKFLGYKYILHYDFIPPCTIQSDTPPCTDFPDYGKTGLRKNRTHNNTDINNTNNTNTDTICGTDVPPPATTVKKTGLKAKENNNVVKIYEHWEKCLNKTYDRTSDTYTARLQTIKRALAKYSYQTIADVIEYKVTSKYTKSYELSSILGNYLSQNIENMQIWLYNNKIHTVYDDRKEKVPEKEKRLYNFDNDYYND